MVAKIKINKLNNNTNGIVSQDIDNSDMVLDLKHINDEPSGTNPLVNAQVEKIVRNEIPKFKKEILPEEEIAETEKEEEIEDSLSEIYHDDNGNIVDVKRLDRKKRKGVWFYLFFFTILVLLGWGGYQTYRKYSYLWQNTNAEKITFNIEGKNKLVAGEEFLYSINYGNQDNTSVVDVIINANFPKDYIFLESEPAPELSSSTQNAVWKIGRLSPGQKGKIEIKGKMIKPVGQTGVIMADMVYKPEKLTTEFKKSASYDSEIVDLGISFKFDNYSSVLVGQESEITVTYKAAEKSYLDNFELSISSLENMDLSKDKNSLRPGVWQIEKITNEENTLPIKFTIKEKKNPSEEVGIKIEYKENGISYLLLEKTIDFEVMKNDLNLNLIINGSGGDQGVDFGQKMNYSINYANKGENAMKDVVLMAVLASDYLNWDSLEDDNNGVVKNDMITWDKDQISALENLAPGQEGIIDFSINVASSTKPKADKNYQVKSYIQFSIGQIGDASSTKKEVEPSKDTRSNIIINKINSNVDLSEGLRYFNDDNIAVGSGPLPPKIGATTTFKVYWNLSNGLHELRDLKVTCRLPDYVGWDGKNSVSVGSINFDNVNNEIVWNIGRLPVSDYDVKAEFFISIVPSDDDYDKIMVLLPGSYVAAIDAETNSDIKKSTSPKTSKLEGDEIAASMGNDGRVTR